MHYIMLNYRLSIVVYLVNNVSADLPKPWSRLAWITLTPRFTQAECDVYGQEYMTSGWTGALHNYRHRRTAFAPNIAEQLTFSGRTIDVPAWFIAGKQDWGANRIAGGPEAVGRNGNGYTKFMGTQLVDRAGHWPQEEQPEIVGEQIVAFLQAT